jgi:hypothetical protein
MRKRRYETLLPLKYNDGRPIDEELFEQTREELVAQFGGLCVQPNVVRGIWLQEGTRYEDELLRYFVDVEDTPENEQFFVSLKATLLERFEQIEIYVASYLVDIL